MGIIKLLLILLTCVLVGGVGGLFMVRNDAEVPVQTLLSANPLHITVGELSAYSFLFGLGLGLILCVAYILIQLFELRAAKRKVRSYEKQLESVRSDSFKDNP
ncbi:MAG: hypothetical protein R3208_10670 [Ketobacteraceae bacterium]|nr:hypothetical protein [Ketobacteraceae bacterium]